MVIASSSVLPSEAPRYRADPDTYDEMVRGDEAVREHWDHVARALDELGTDELGRRAQHAGRLLGEDGVTFRAYGGPAGESSRWQLDPVPVLVSSQDWAVIEAGVTERAELLSLILEDIYGPRDLLRRGVIPPDVVFSDPGFLRQCDGVRLPTALQLFAYAADIARDASGRSVVMADRAQAPWGFGYALENRRVISRVFPSLYRDSHVHRLAPFFRSLRVALQAAAPPQADDPRIVVLTPGPLAGTAFEHAFLASYLGYPLVEGSDLTVRGGRVWLRSLGRLEPVDVILRRVDGWFCDPLELRPDSQLGIPGLLEAARRGTVSVVNPLGSQVLENPALLAFLPAVSEHLLGRTPRLDSVRTWWCGDEKSRSFVLAHLEQLIVKPIDRAPDADGTSPTRFGPALSTDELDTLRRAIAARPAAWVGQELVALGSTPTLTADGLAPRRSLLRTFAVARGDSYVVMPGGLTRVNSDPDGRWAGASAASKDTWVLASEPERLTGFWLHEGPAVEAQDPMTSIPSRAAENLFWMGRYAERAEDATRLLRAVYDRRREFQGSATPAGVEALRVLLRALTAVTAAYPGFVGDGADARLASPGHELFELVVEEGREGSIAHALRRLLDAAFAVRDQLSNDTWLVVGSLDREILQLRGPLVDPQAAVEGALQRVMQSLLALAGLGSESMVRDMGWRFLDAGRRVERAVQVLSLLQATVTEARDTATDSLVWESVLTAAESIITYRRRYRSQAQLETLLDLVLLDAGNPRSVAYQIDRVMEDLTALPPTSDRPLREDQRLLLQASTTLRLADTAQLVRADQDGARAELRAFVSAVLDLVLRAADALHRAHFVHLAPRWSLVGAGDSLPGGSGA